MKIANAVSFLRSVDFHKYNAKSDGESLLIHSHNTYFLAHKIAEKYITGLTVDEITKIEVASLLHDYGKTYPKFQKKLHGAHKLKDEHIPLLKDIISREIKGLDNSDIEDIIYIIQNHHSVDLSKANSKRGRLTRIVSVCDTAVSNENLTPEIINSLYALIDSTDYEIFAVELTEHPISSYAIGTFDYIYARSGIEPILFSKNGTLFIKKIKQELPEIEDVNKFLKIQVNNVFTSSGTVDFDRRNVRIFTDPENFLKLASTPDEFVGEATQAVQRRLSGYKNKDFWNDEVEMVYLYGRVCGSVHDSIVKLCKVTSEKLSPKGSGGHVNNDTIQFIEKKYGKNKSYSVIIRTILEKFSSDIQKTLEMDDYDVKDLLIKSSLNSQDEVKIDIQTEAKNDYNEYWAKNPTKVCRVCHTFVQTKTTAAQFPKSELGGKTDVFYTDLMRRSPELKEGGGICKWCLLWFALLKSKTGNRMYKLCVQPHGVFGRINWDDIFDADQIISIGNPRENYVYPHVAVTGLSGQNYSAFISKVVNSSGNGGSILDKLYENGLRGKVVSTLIEPSSKLFDCGGASINVEKYPLIEPAIKKVKASRGSRNNFSLVVRAFNQRDDFGRDFPYAWGSLIKTKKLQEDRDMINELGEKTGLSFLRGIWIGGVGDTRVSNAEKVVRRVNETLRKLKDTENKEAVIDSMIAIGLKIAISTRDFKTWEDERKQDEIAAFKEMAEKLYEYKDHSAQRTELVRSMAYYLAYVS